MSTFRAKIYKLPPEILARAFDLLSDLADIIRAAHVCQQWRPLAYSAFAFSRHIVLNSSALSTLDFAYFRLSCGGQCILRLSVNVPTVDRLVETEILPFIAAALPRARILYINIDTIYRLQLEKVLSLPAPNLRDFRLEYVATPLPDIPLTMPLTPDLFAGEAAQLRMVVLKNVILPRTAILAFRYAEQLNWVHSTWSLQAEFPCYLFDFFPNLKRLVLLGGGMEFRNAPLPPHIIDLLLRLDAFFIEFYERFFPGFFHHLPMDKMRNVIVSDSDEDTVYAALTPLRSPFDLSIYAPASDREFFITVRGKDPQLVRHFAEGAKYYTPGSELTNALLENGEFADQLRSFLIQTSLWAMLIPWLPPFHVLPVLIVEIDDPKPTNAALPVEPLPCPGLTALVLQANYDFAYVAVRDVLDFADRITTERVNLELRRVLLDGPRVMIDARFNTVTYYEERYVTTQHPL
ncbi:hypothetical protein EXIGLDRAFT_730342, partial [Exidia glandulosa HHB12029]